MKLKELCGDHVLTGVDKNIKKVEGWCRELEDCSCISFTLDGLTYSAVEDPDDGWRSSMRDLVTFNDHAEFVIPATNVVCRMRDDEKYMCHDVLEVLCAHSGKLLLAVGTDNCDDYYPCFVSEWHPENLKCNTE